MAFKCGQSVFTDVIRVSLSLLDGGTFSWVALPQAVLKLQKVLAAAAEPLGLERVPRRSDIVTALVRWHRAQVVHASDAA